MTEDAPNPPDVPRRAVRSFVLRSGRLTGSQSRALNDLYPAFGVPVDNTPIDPVTLFGRDAPLWVEIGFGNGESLVSLAAAHPDINVLGIEVHRPGVGHCLHRMQETGIANLRVLEQDAVIALGERLPVASVARLLVLFPDPWHKKRHHKRRLINAEFAEIAARAIVPGGVWHLATDWEPYAEWMHEAIGTCAQFRNRVGEGLASEPPAYRMQTRFEARGLLLGHRVQDLEFERLAP
ncbi:MAG: tRNA (guanosine(46)-N7)-methyltransferase TrmB [Pseudomonadota bacterium]